jgi:peptidoglycan/LPS O-acetylase OafA/YrhL
LRTLARLSRDSSSPSRPSASAPRDGEPWRGHIPALDGVRGLAVALVIASHVVMHAERPAGIIDRAVIHLAASGWIGVDLFFVLSGFLITGILVDARGSDGFFRNFYMRRTLRIFPLYYGILFGFIVVIPWLSAAAQTDPVFAVIRDHQWWFWTYTTNVLQAIDGTWLKTGVLGHFWSLAIEEQFYLVWPAVVFFCPPRRLLQVCGAIVLASFVLRIVLRMAGVPPLGIYTLMPLRADTLAAGAWLAVMVRTRADLGPLRAQALRILLVCALAGAALFAHHHPLYEESLHVQTIGYTCFALGFAAMILLALDTPERPSLFGRVCRHPALRFLGKYSYAIYCFHPLVQEVLERFGVTSRTYPGITGGPRPTLMAYSITVVLITIGISLLSWSLFEKHFLRLKERFAN